MTISPLTNYCHTFYHFLALNLLNSRDLSVQLINVYVTVGFGGSNIITQASHDLLRTQDMCFAVLCCAVLCCAVLWCAMLWRSSRGH